MIEESEIRDQLVDLLSDSMSLDEFEDWLVSSSWNMRSDSSAEARRLVAEIELYLSEYSSNYLSYRQLHHHLISLAGHVEVAVELTDDGLVPISRAGGFSTSQPPWWNPDPLVLGSAVVSA